MKTGWGILFIIFCIITLISYTNASDESGNVVSMPVYYPTECIGSQNPYFIWFDLYNERDAKDNTGYRITLKSEKGKDIEPVLLKPDLYNKYYYYFKWPFLLEEDNYTYTIERMSGLKPTNVKYFRYLKYPVTGEFEIDIEEKSVKDDLPPDKLVEYLRLEKENKLVNRNNFFFYSGASAGAFGIGLLFYKVLDFGIISKIIYYIAFTSSAAGICASSYYGVNYVIERNNLQKIADIAKDVSINGMVTAKSIRIEAERLF